MSSISIDSISTCANCGKGGEGEADSIKLKTCTACKLVKYCSRECQIAHRPQHKKECKKRASELHDEDLFKQPPQLDDDCPICFLRMPSLWSGSKYKACCGKLICSGCVHSVALRDNDQLCPFCRTPAPNSEKEMIRRLKNRVDAGDKEANFSLGCHYSKGERCLPQDYIKALELWHRAGELGCSRAYFNIGNAYLQGNGVEVDKNKAIHYWELSAMQGHTNARNNLGFMEYRSGNMYRAVKHYLIAASCGHNISLACIQDLFKDGDATKDDYATALRAHQAHLGEIKSDQRDEAAAFSDEYKYY